MDTLVQDMKYALRALVRNPGFTLVAVVALALGIGANSAIFSVVNAVLLRPLPYPEPDRLMSVWQNNRVRGWHQDVVTPLDFIEWRDTSRSFASMAAYFGAGFNVRTGTEVERLRGADVSVDFFRVLGAPPVTGRDFSAADEGSSGGRVVVLGHALWQRRFGGDPHAVGSSVTLNSESFTIVGIAPPGLQFPEKSDLWTLAKNRIPTNPFVPADTDITKMRGLHYLYAIARLKDGVPMTQAQAEMDTIAARQEKENPQTNSETGVEIIPLHESIVGEVRPALLIFLGAVGLVLLIACANVANMSLARAAARRREIAVRTALGASRRRIVRQCLTESVLLSLVGGAAGLLFALWGTDLLAALAPEAIPGGQSVGIDLWVLGFTLALSVLTGVLFGLLPALQASAAEPQDVLREGGRTSSAGRRARLMRGSLVVSEMAVALVLLTGAGLLVKSFLRLQRIDPGLAIDRLLTLRIRIPDARYSQQEKQIRFYDDVLRRIQGLPGVTAAGLTSDLPLGGTDSFLGFGIEGRPQEKLGQGPEGGWHQVSPDYFRTMGIPLLRGRGFDARDLRQAPGVAVVSQTLARRYWPGEDPIGRRITFGTDDKGESYWTTIVGVVADVRQKGLHAEPRPEIYVSSMQSPSRYATLIVRSGLDPAGLAASVRREVQGVDPDIPLYDVKTMREVLDGSLAARRFNMALLALFAAVAVLLAGVGLYGVLAYMVTQRTHEIGVRMALGARPRDVLRLVVGQGMALALGGVLLGILGALALTRVLSTLLVGVAATDPWTFGIVVPLLSAVALLACYVPARRAARVDPLIALRYE
ncbi:MAG TPA: ABC transporter permease [Candidatus Polarisedimenticolia bacterium]|jgi:putative ABC transport system permease protein|nr:ABC transporter permease [Candidatus Polarisedimenticolia bacterium]